MAMTTLHKKRPTTRERALYKRAYNPSTLNIKRKADRKRAARLTGRYKPYFIADSHVCGGQWVYQRDPKFKRPGYSIFLGHVKAVLPVIFDYRGFHGCPVSAQKS